MPKEYRVSVNEDYAAPEETLLDAGSEFSNLEQPISTGVFTAAFWVVGIFFFVVIGVSARIGIFQNSYFANLAFQNRSANVLVAPPRGIIYDTTGAPLVTNIPVFDLVGVSKEIKSLLASEDSSIDTIAKILQKTHDEVVTTLTDQSKAAGVFFVATDLTKDQILAIQYANPKGLYIVPDAQRAYVDGPEFSQLVGYVGRVNKDDLMGDPYYAPTDTIGRLGIETEYENELRGEHGRIFFGQSESALNSDPAPGNNIVLNIDADLQRTVYRELKNSLALGGLTRGAAIVQNPQTGAVLAMVSLPSFDSNDFVNGLSQDQFKAIFENTSHPLFNRVVSGLYNPGSTIKPLMGLMGLEEGVITPQTTIQDCVSITIPNPFQKDVSYTFKNWRVDLGPFNLRRSIANSCNVFFMTVGGGFGNIGGLGIERMDKYFKAALVDQDLGIDLPSEEVGFVPTADWKLETRGQPWYQGDTYNTSIGQGDLLVTPLWINSYIAAVANGGTMYQPQVAQQIQDTNKNPIQTFSPKVLTKLPFDDSILKEIKSDMQETVLSGTAQSLKDLPVSAGAKTGTAEVIKGQSTNSLFTAFAPFDNPQVVITVLVENSPANHALAIGAANNILKWYFTPPLKSDSP